MLGAQRLVLVDTAVGLGVTDRRVIVDLRAHLAVGVEHEAVNGQVEVGGELGFVFGEIGGLDGRIDEGQVVKGRGSVHIEGAVSEGDVPVLGLRGGLEQAQLLVGEDKRLRQALNAGTVDAVDVAAFERDVGADDATCEMELAAIAQGEAVEVEFEVDDGTGRDERGTGIGQGKRAIGVVDDLGEVGGASDGVARVDAG